MSRRRREFVHLLTALVLSGAAAACCAAAVLKPGLWECHWCHQQYQGDSLPASLRTAKCPAKEMKQTHFWSKKN